MTDDAVPLDLLSTRTCPKTAVRRGAAWTAERHRAAAWCCGGEGRAGTWPHRRAVMGSERRRPHRSDGAASQRRRATAWRGGPVRHDHPCLEGGLVVWPPRADGPPGIIARRGVVATAACSSWLASPAGAGAPAVAARLLPEDPEPGTESKQPGPWTRPDQRRCVVGATGFEPVASSVSAKCKEPLCGTPFPQVMPDRRGRS